ncbi:MAG: alpha-amylase [Spirochaetaceae bacterium]|nr:alpha-amylase [Spirochaetaceae bacterium]
MINKMIATSAKLSVLLILAVALLFSCASGTSAGSGDALMSADPGAYEDAAPAGLDKVIALNEKLAPSDDELVVYYVRPDKNYEPWALWVWAFGSGAGDASWDYTQEWQVEDDIGYMRLKLDGSSTGGNPPVNAADGKVGLIARQDGGWTKDGNDDRIWDTNTSKSVVIFSGDMNTYAVKPYSPRVARAELATQTEIDVELSSRFGLDVDGGLSGFTVKSKDGKDFAIASVVNSDSPTDPTYNYTKYITITLAEPIQPSDALVISNPALEGDKDVDSTKLAVKLADKATPSADTALGVSYSKSSKSAEFKLWAPTSSSVKLNLYKKDTATTADYTVDMVLDVATGVWSATFNQVDPDGMFYDFTVQNTKGTVVVLDPYAKSMAAYRNQGGPGRAAVVDMDSAKAGKMTADYVKLAKREDAVIYEMSVRDFTISSDSGVKAPKGTYTAFIEKIPYLKELGITHVQLMPVLNFYFTDETNRKYEDKGTVNNNNYNWGYDPHNYFTPEGWYASDATDPYARIAELRQLIDECHKAGIGVLLDVVYNHMAGTSFLDDIVPGYFFRTNAQGAFTSNSGCGNDVATERAMARRLIVDSIRWWVDEYKVDGFRFDLMGLIDTQTVLDGYEAAKKINPDVLFEGEGWKMYNGAAGTVGMDQNYMLQTDSVAVFNDEFRDLLKAGGFNEAGQGFITKKEINTDRLFSNLIGQPVVNYRADAPGDNLQYIAAHDGLTLHDCVFHNARLDESDPAQKAEGIRRIKMGNFFIMTSQGIAFMHGGQERGRTKPNVTGATNESVGKFVRNSYDSSDSINQFVWTLDEDYKGLFEYTKSMIALRRAHEVFRIGNHDKVSAAAKQIAPTEKSGLVIGYSLKWDDGTWYILANAKKDAASFDLGKDAASALVFADENGGIVDGKAVADASGLSVNGSVVTLDPLTAVVIRIK